VAGVLNCKRKHVTVTGEGRVEVPLGWGGDSGVDCHSGEQSSRTRYLTYVPE
jgi:hypothetical protein